MPTFKDLNTLSAEDRADTIANEINAALPEDYRHEVYRESLDDSEYRSKRNLARKVLLVGGAGYIGTTVTRHLLERGYAVKSLDNLIYGHYFTVLPFLLQPNYEFVNVDLRDTSTSLSEATDCTDIVILAGLVGDPITKKYPEESESINTVALQNFITGLKTVDSVRRVVFVSTCSNYGLIESDELAAETHELNPLSLYAKSKVAMEELLISETTTAKYSATILRFATAFGYSPRMRFDLTVSEFTRDLFLGKELVVYDADTWRPYCHVEDFGELIRRTIEAPKERIHSQIFNAGSDSNNLTKRMIVDAVCDTLPTANVRFQEHGSDPRNYRVDFRKVRSALYFDAGYNLKNGIQELLSILQLGLFTDNQVRGNSLHGNYELRET